MTYKSTIILMGVDEKGFTTSFYSTMSQWTIYYFIQVTIKIDRLHGQLAFCM